MSSPSTAWESSLGDRPVLTRPARLAVWLAGTGMFCLLAWLCPLERWCGPLERLLIDARFAARGERPMDRRIVVVEIAEADRRKLAGPGNRFELRRHLAPLIHRLADAGAVVIGLDVWLQGEQNTEVDEALSAALADANVVTAVAVADEMTLRAPPVLREAGADEGAIAVECDPDGVLRRLPALPNLDVVSEDGTEIAQVPHFPFVLAWHVLADAAEALGAATPNLSLPATGVARLGDRTVAYRGLVNYAAGPGPRVQRLSFADVVAGSADLAEVDGAAVLVGSTRSVEDQFRMPIAEGLTPGVYYHANVLNMILEDRPLRERPASGQQRRLLLVTALLGGLLFLRLRPGGAGRWAWLRLIGVTGLGFLFLATAGLYAGFRAFEQDIVWPLAGPMVTLSAVWIVGLGGQLGYSLAEARRLAEQHRRIEKLLDRNVSAPVLAMLKADPGRITRTHIHEVSVLFCDIRGYTRATTGMSPQIVAAMLNEFFESITSAVLERDGFVDKFVGDELMAVFGAPIPQADHAERAASAALAIKAGLAVLNARRAERGEPLLDCGVGIHCGPAAAGPIGTTQRANYTVVGETVNLAARIEELTTGGEILISQDVRDQLPANCPAEPWTEVQLRGSNRMLKIWRLPVKT